jgi:hypothetical protein
MKIKIVLLTTLFLAFSTIGFAQSNKPQQLRRYAPQMNIDEQKFGQDKLSVNSEKGIPIKTKQSLMGYLTERFKIAHDWPAIYKAQDANNLYFVMVTVNKDRQAEDSPLQSLLLVLREQGGVVSEVSKAEEETDAAVKVPAFFLGRNKTLIIISESAPDGSLFGHSVYEYADENLKPLSYIPVIDKIGMSGSVWVTNNEIGLATAEYKNSTYYVTIRGKGTLYESRGYNKNKKIASPNVPVTYYYVKGEWRLVARR